MFTNRTEAGERLAAAVVEHGLEPDVVLAIPRGGLPLGRAVADAVDAPLDVVVAKKIGAPGNPEYAIGAVTAGGREWLNDAVVRQLGIGRERVQQMRDREARSAREKEQRYRGDRTPVPVEGKTVAIVDDGVATGATMRACVEGVRDRGASRIVVAVPVGSPETIRELHGLVDEVVCLRSPPSFRAVGQFYRSFDQVTDEEAMRYLG
ncbi:phosphoribosyltransferase family protein [Haloarculaceae archaeon H-GB2-1]|nr:phosphoribosyltransferase family protein [Haloarculaceae archaeon H-GB1-1]MEA5386682.1 phosphoribosyltransferase family protein [Haloarculaceae archaeon H-GB11]MEA5408208.1 phosphoribosyltransferase family protein [Haloarculaceae archaeon H-GB2-1]